MWACSTGSTPALAGDHRRSRCGKPPRGISHRTRCPAWPTCRPTRGAISPRIGSARAFAVTGSSARLRSAPSPRVQRPASVAAARAAGARCTTSPGFPAPTCWCGARPGVPLVTLGHLCPPPASSIRRSRPGSVRCWSARRVRGAGDFDAAALAFAFERLGGTLAASSVSDWLGFGASVLVEHLGEAADAAGHRFPPSPPAPRPTSRPSVSS